MIAGVQKTIGATYYPAPGGRPPAPGKCSALVVRRVGRATHEGQCKRYAVLRETRPGHFRDPPGLEYGWCRQHAPSSFCAKERATGWPVQDHAKTAKREAAKDALVAALKALGPLERVSLPGGILPLLCDLENV